MEKSALSLSLTNWTVKSEQRSTSAVFQLAQPEWIKSLSKTTSISADDCDDETYTLNVALPDEINFTSPSKEMPLQVFFSLLKVGSVADEENTIRVQRANKNNDKRFIVC